MTSAAELAVLRKQTAAFIDENPTVIFIKRATTRTPDGAGGFTKTPDVLEAQSFRKIVQTQSNTAENVDSDRAHPEFVLIGKFDADIKSGDTFKLNSIQYNVQYVRDDRRYETWAEVVLSG